MKEIIQFREVEPKDFKTIHKWLNEKHVREFFQPEEINLEQVISKYQPRLDENHPVIMHMALLDNNVFAYIQSYRVMDFPKHSKTIEEVHGFSIDYFIGEPQDINIGLGSQMINSYVTFAASELIPDEKDCFVSIRKDNLKSIHACKNAGFTEVRSVIEDGYPCLVLQKEIE